MDVDPELIRYVQKAETTDGRYSIWVTTAGGVFAGNVIDATAYWREFEKQASFRGDNDVTMASPAFVHNFVHLRSPRLLSGWRNAAMDNANTTYADWTAGWPDLKLVRIRLDSVVAWGIIETAPSG